MHADKRKQEWIDKHMARAHELAIESANRAHERQDTPSAAQDREMRMRYPDPAPWGRQDWSNATPQEMSDHLDRIGPMWGNKDLLASKVVEAFWIAYEALERLGAE